MNWNSSLRDLKKQQAVWELFQHEKAIEPQILHLTQLKFFLQHPPPSSWPWPARFKYSKQSFLFHLFLFQSILELKKKMSKIIWLIFTSAKLSLQMTQNLICGKINKVVPLSYVAHLQRGMLRLLIVGSIHVGVQAFIFKMISCIDAHKWWLIIFGNHTSTQWIMNSWPHPHLVLTRRGGSISDRAY